MDKYKVSVIVPVYNTPARELRESIDSLISQDMDNYEVIVVNDGSTEQGTRETLKKYGETGYGNLTVLDLNPNRGAAAARNEGFRQAAGEYTIFLDADDCFAPSLLRQLYEKAKGHDADICLCELSFFQGEMEHPDITGQASIPDGWPGGDAGEAMLNLIPASGCNRLCRSAYLRENGIVFQQLPTDNDLSFALLSVLCTKRIAVLHGPELFLYRFHTEFQTSSGMNPLNMLAAVKKVHNEIGKSVYPDPDKKVAAYAVVTGIHEINHSKSIENAKTFYREFREYLLGMDFSFSNALYRLYAEFWLSREFESKWFGEGCEFFVQLEKNGDALLEEIRSFHMPVFVWGMGKRGRAFEKWCFEHGISIEGLCDRSGRAMTGEDTWNNRILECSRVKESRGVIVATNHRIFEDLSADASGKQVIVDLEKYCPLH